MTSPAIKTSVTTENQVGSKSLLPENDTHQPHPVVSTTAQLLREPSETQHLNQQFAQAQEDTTSLLRPKKPTSSAQAAVHRTAQVSAENSENSIEIRAAIEENIAELKKKIARCTTTLKHTQSENSEHKKIEQEIAQYTSSIARLESKMLELSGVRIIQAPPHNELIIQRARALLENLCLPIEHARSELESTETAHTENEIRLFYRTSEAQLVQAIINGYLDDPAWKISDAVKCISLLDQQSSQRLLEVAVKTVIQRLDLFHNIKDELIAQAENQTQVAKLLRSLPLEKLSLLKDFISHLHFIFNTQINFSNASVTLIPALFNKPDDMAFLQRTKQIGPAILCSAVLQSDPKTRAAHASTSNTSDLSQASILDVEEFLYRTSAQEIEQQYSLMIDTLTTSIAGKDKEKMETELSTLKETQQKFEQDMLKSSGEKTSGQKLADLEFRLAALERNPKNNDQEIHILQKKIQTSRTALGQTEEGGRLANIKLLGSQLEFMYRTTIAINTLEQKKAEKLRILTANPDEVQTDKTKATFAHFEISQNSTDST